MDNIEVKVDGNKLVITVLDVANRGKPSSTGKTRLIARAPAARCQLITPKSRGSRWR